MQRSIKAYTGAQAQAMGLLPHERISKCMTLLHRFLYHAVRVCTFGKKELHFEVPRRPLTAVDIREKDRCRCDGKLEEIQAPPGDTYRQVPIAFEEMNRSIADMRNKEGPTSEEFERHIHKLAAIGMEVVAAKEKAKHVR